MRNSRFGMLVLLVGMLVAFGLPACDSSSSDGGDGGSGADGDVDGTTGGDNPGGDNPGGDNGGSGDMPICDEVAITADSVPPNLLLVVDKSGSMDEETADGSGRTKMQDLKQAAQTLLNQGRGTIRFGWMSYPDCTGCSTGYCDPGRVTVPVGDDTVDAILGRLSSLTSAGGTPTGESLEAADDYFTDLADNVHRSFVMLITDGLPTCPNGNGRNATDADAQLSLQAVQTLRSHGVDTFVIGLGEDINSSNPDLLNEMAVAGGQARDGASKYFQANSVAELEAVLAQIGGMVIGCNIALGTLPEFPDFLWVYFDGQPVPKDGTHTNGWDYDPARNAIDFYGSYCDQLRDGDVESLEVKMGCAPPD